MRMLNALRRGAVLVLTGCCLVGVAGAKPDKPDWNPRENFAMKDVIAARKTIDRLLDEAHDRQRVKANFSIKDEIFVRRAYLDIAGRIPTAAETRSFLEDKSIVKRSNKIDELLASEGFVSRFYHFYADLLRLKTRLNNQAPGGPAYIEWVKEALRKDTPYDRFVYDLLTSEGYSWDDPAVGYYLRDPGMPLDNMANTVQVFLGTRLQCAQCHDHPFDKWKQMDFYHMAAFTYGVSTRVPVQNLPMVKQARQVAKKEQLLSRKDEGPVMRRAMRNLLEPLLYGAYEQPKAVKLPHDYKYDDAKPKSVVAPRTMFGDNPPASIQRNPRAAYATWLVSPGNPRFAQVMANRLWKEVMGRGLIEPVDDYKDDTEAAIPELMDYLTQLFVDTGFSVKDYLRVLYNTNAYQRQAYRDDIDPAQPYLFPGPLLRRMSAEQMWDSYLTLIVRDLDERAGQDGAATGQMKKMLGYQAKAEKLRAMSPKELVLAAKDVAAIEKEFGQEQTRLRKLSETAATPKERNAARKKAQQIRRDMFKAMNEVVMGEGAGGGYDAMMMMTMDGGGKANRKTIGKKRFDPRWKGLERGMVRASEISSPAPDGHFLQQFGQSDREVIENANDEASVPQALTLLNGPGSRYFKSPQAVLYQEFKNSRTEQEELDALFLSVLSRKPTSGERDLFGDATKTLVKDKRFDYVAWVLVNSQEFRFVQ